MVEGRGVMPTAEAEFAPFIYVNLSFGCFTFPFCPIQSITSVAGNYLPKEG